MKTTINVVWALFCLKKKGNTIRRVEIAFLMLVLFCFALHTPSWAQDNANTGVDVMALKVGSKLPESFWHQEHLVYQNGNLNTSSLEKYKGKLILLDFWASWCGTCISKFPMLMELQNKYQNDLTVILVNTKSTKDSLGQISLLFNSQVAPFKTYTLPSMVKDVYLDGLFPHYLLPHYVWIVDGYVNAITGPDHIDEGVIDRMLSHRIKIKSKNISAIPVN